MLAAVAGGCGRKDNPNTAEAETRGIPVYIQRVATTQFSDILALQGSVISENYALVPAKTGGTVEALLVKEGDFAAKDQILCRLDSENLKRVTETRQAELEVAQSALTVARAQADQASTSRDLAAKDYERYRKLVEEAAVSVQQFDVAETQWKNSEAAYKVAEAQVELSSAQVKQAKAALAIAKRDLQDATVRAPIDGIVSRTYRELGEMVESGAPVFRIDNPSSVEISAFIPVQFYSRVVPEATLMHARVNGHDLGFLPISYRSAIADENLRTFEVKVRLDNPPDGAVAGSMADVEIILMKREGPGVPAGSILTRSGEPVIFAVENGRARLCPVKTGLQTGGLVEILDGLPGLEVDVVTRGQDMLNDGDAVAATEE